MDANTNALKQLYALLEERRNSVVKIENAIRVLEDELGLSIETVTKEDASVGQPMRNGANPKRGKPRSVKALFRQTILDAGRFLHKSEIMDRLREHGYKGTSSTISGTLSHLTKAGYLHVIKYGDSQNFHHYGLREWIREGEGMIPPTFASPEYTPIMQRAGHISENEIDWNLQ